MSILKVDTTIPSLVKMTFPGGGVQLLIPIERVSGIYLGVGVRPLCPPLDPCMEGSGETARLHRLAQAFAARISNMYQTQFTLKSVRLVCILFKILSIYLM